MVEGSFCRVDMLVGLTISNQLPTAFNVPVLEVNINNLHLMKFPFSFGITKHYCTPQTFSFHEKTNQVSPVTLILQLDLIIKRKLCVILFFRSKLIQ